MRILLIHTAGSEGSVALADTEAAQAIVAMEVLPGRTSSERLVPVVRRLLEARGWRLGDLAAVVADTLVVVDGAAVDGMVVDGTADGMVVSGGVAGAGAALGSGFISPRYRCTTPRCGGMVFRTITRITPTIDMTAAPVNT